FGIEFYKGAFETLYAFFSEPYRGLDTRLHQTILPNSSGNGWVCIGNEAARDELQTATRRLSSWEAKAETVIGTFWGSSFNDHLLSKLTARAPRLHANLAS